MTAPFLFLLLRRQRALREHGLAMLGTPGRVCAGLVAPTPPNLGAPPHAPGVCAGLAAPTPPDLGAPPQPPGVCAGLEPLRPLIWALRPNPRVTFPSRGKSPKARQGLCPLESPKGDAIAPPAASRNPLDGGSATAKDRFATLSLWANRSLLFHLALTKRNLLLSIRGAGASRGRCGCTFVCNF